MNDEFNQILFGSTGFSNSAKVPLTVRSEIPERQTSNRPTESTLPPRAEAPEGDRLPRAICITDAPANWTTDGRHEWLGPAMPGFGLPRDSLWWDESAVDYNRYRIWLEENPNRLACLPSLYGKTLVYPDGCQHWDVLVDCCEASLEREGIVLSDLSALDDQYFTQCNHDKLVGSWRMDEVTGEVSCRICGKFLENEVARKSETVIKTNSPSAPTLELF